MPDYITKLTNWTYQDIKHTIDHEGDGVCYLNALDFHGLKFEAEENGLNVELEDTIVVFTRKHDVLPHSEER